MLFAMDFMGIGTEATGWLSEWLPNFSGVSISAAIVLAMTYLWLWLVLPMLRKQGWTKIKLPLGVSFEVENTVEHANMDMILIESINATSKQLDRQAHTRMREVMYELVNSAMTKCSGMQEYLRRTRLPLSEIITDNNIVSSMSDHGLEKYIAQKQKQVLDTMGIEPPPATTKVINNIVRDFISQVLVVQRRCFMDKVAAYERVLEMFKMDGNKIRCQAKLQKNRELLAITDEFKGQTGVFKVDHAVPDGARLIQQNIDRMEDMIDGMIESDTIKTVSKPARKRRTKKTEDL